MTVPTGGFTGTFTITTSAVAATHDVTITASFNGTTRTATLTVTPAGAPPPAPTLQSLAGEPGQRDRRHGRAGRVVLSGAAPAGGAAVSLSSSNPGVAACPRA